MFLVGKGIPGHITSLPQTVLNTPFGQMLKPSLDNAIRGVTQAPVPPNSIPQVPQAGLSRSSAMNGFPSAQSNRTASKEKLPVIGVVHKPTTLRQLDDLLVSASKSCAILFFTSATCPPCKIVYPAYDELAAEAGSRACFIKIDISEAYEIGQKYQVRVTPTFMTLLKGEKENEWSGANESQLRGNVKLLLQMAYPPHPHSLLRLPTLLRRRKVISFSKVPPMDKLFAKMGSYRSDPSIISLRGFVEARQQNGAQDAPLPHLPELTSSIVKSIKTLPSETLFPLADLFRAALVDVRLSGYLAEDTYGTVQTILEKVVTLDTKCPYSLRLVTIQMACNLFSTPLFPPKLLSDPAFSGSLLQLVTSSLLDHEHPSCRVSAASLAFNIALSNHKHRMGEQGDSAPEGPRLEAKAEHGDILPEGLQVELTAGLLEAIGQEKENKEGFGELVSAVGLLKHCSPSNGELADLCMAVGAKDIIREAKGAFKDQRELAGEVEQLMQ